MSRDPFLLDPDIIYLNHGAYGACPAPVFKAYRRWQRQLERQPVEFLSRQAEGLLAVARERLAQAFGTRRDNLAFITNATTGINVVARSLPLKPGDEVLSTDHEYGAVDRVWRCLGEQQGFRLLNLAVPTPLSTPEEFVERVWSGVHSRTRVLCLSHITSPTGLVFPVEELVRRARERGIWTVLDGAHVPGQIPLDLEGLGVDFYSANLHKWLCAPKGAAFLYARPEVQELIRPLIISWGWENPEPTIHTPYVDYVQSVGTRDISAFLCAPAALDFCQEHHGPKTQERCRALARKGRERLLRVTRTPPLAPASWLAQMAAVELPAGVDPSHLKKWLYSKHRIEVPVWRWNGRPMLRISIQSYNRESDVEALVKALRLYLEL